MEEDLGKEGIELKAKKPRSQKQIDAFETARAIRMENAKLKKEGISKVKEDVKNRNKVGELKVPPTTPSLPEPDIEKELIDKKIIKSPLPLVKAPLPLVKSDSEDEVVIVKKKKKPKVIYIDGSSDEEPEPIRVKKEKVNIPIVDKIPESLTTLKPLVIKPTIRFC